MKLLLLTVRFLFSRTIKNGRELRAAVLQEMPKPVKRPA